MNHEKYTLIITEKPEAARHIAEALDASGRPRKAVQEAVPYFVANRDRPIVIVPALGHLYTVVQAHGRRDHYPIFSIKWVPRHLAEKNAGRVKTWIEAISKLAENADAFVDACDYDIEGTLIGYTVLKYACGDKEKVATRMKYSTLTRAELEKSYDERMPHLDFGMIEAGRTRHEVDWLYGVNLSRALTVAASRWSGRYMTLSTGRVQGPTLSFLAAREHSISSYVPTPYWSILAEVKIQGKKYPVDYHKRIIRKKAEASVVVEACSGRQGIIEKIEEKTTHVPSPTPFDLTSLQTEAYSIFGYTPRRTGDIAEHLYLETLVSYPRTSSQKLPPIINYAAILNGLKHETAYRKLASELLGREQLKPREGAKDDPAHPAIYPTGNMPQRTMDSAERHIFDLVVKRFMAVFGESAIKQSLRASINVNDYRFFMQGKSLQEEGWIKYYKPYARFDEVTLPPIKPGDTVQLENVSLEDRFTKPPPRYNPSSLLKRMETEGIGTKSTRADMIETLYNRGYVIEEHIAVTDLGLNIIEILRRYALPVISVRLTRELEEKMERIQNNNEKRQQVLNETIDRLKSVLTELKKDEANIGKTLGNAIDKARAQERIVGKCPTCHTGDLMIIFSKKTKKRFIGCTNFFKGACGTSFPLPQRGTIRSAGRTCKSCNWPLVLVQMPHRYPWNLCFNPSCPKRRKKETP